MAMLSRVSSLQPTKHTELDFSGFRGQFSSFSGVCLRHIACESKDSAFWRTNDKHSYGRSSSPKPVLEHGETTHGISRMFGTSAILMTTKILLDRGHAVLRLRVEFGF